MVGRIIVQELFQKEFISNLRTQWLAKRAKHIVFL